MEKPSWFDTSNQLSELTDPQSVSQLQAVLGGERNLHRLRCLWLLSFVQDLGSFMSSSAQLYQYGLREFGALQEALMVLKRDMRLDGPSSAQGAAPSDKQQQRLSCLFFISLLFQSSAEATERSSKPNEIDVQLDRVRALDTYLQENHQLWYGSPEIGLFDTLFHRSAATESWSPSHDYVFSLTKVVGSLSSEARNGIEMCLLHLLCRAPANAARDESYEWTPDALLSSIHGE